MTYSFGDITSIPPALSALFAIFSAAYVTDSTGQAVTYWFGAVLPAWEAATTVELNGVHPADQQPADLGPRYTREETFSVDSRITVFSGTAPSAASFIANMGDVWNVWKALETAVANNPTLNNTVRYAEFGEMDYTPATDGKGLAMGTLTWFVRCSQRVTSLS